MSVAGPIARIEEISQRYGKSPALDSVSAEIPSGKMIGLIGPDGVGKSFFLGKGAAYAQADADIRAFIERTGIPFIPMSMAKGLLPDNHPQSVAAARSYALAQADAVMLIGARLNWLLGHGKSPQWSPTAKFVQLDILPSEMDSNRAINAPVVGDICSSMSALLAGLPTAKVGPNPKWLSELAQRQGTQRPSHGRTSGGNAAADGLLQRACGDQSRACGPSRCLSCQ